MASIRLRDVQVHFKVSAQQHNTLKGAVALRLWRRRDTARVIRALSDINISISSGERVGLIGRNGAGKSTLLKTMAGIYPPQTGEVGTEGHICPLFEFVTGFEMAARPSRR